MGIYKLVKNQETIVRNHDENHSIKNYLTRDFNENFSVAVSELNGELTLTKSTSSDRIYYFVEGKATFRINEEDLIVENADVLFIEKNTEYSIVGKFKAVLINLPAFKKENDVNT